MDTKNNRARKVMESIREVLLRDWDPIGVADDPAAQDEYDSYVGAIYRLLANRAGPKAIAQHLANIECEAMGLPGRSVEGLIPIAHKLYDLDVRLETS